jgi:hypothetical protein
MKARITKARFDHWWKGLSTSYPNYHQVQGAPETYREALERFSLEELELSREIIRRREAHKIECDMEQGREVYKPQFPTISEIESAAREAARELRPAVILAVTTTDGYCYADNSMKGLNIQCACKKHRPALYCSVVECYDQHEEGKETCWHHVRGIEVSGPAKGSPIEGKTLEDALEEIAAKKEMP